MRPTARSRPRPIERPLFFVLATVLALAPLRSEAGGPADPESIVLGLMVSAGGRYDDVRMCVATGAGVKGGLALDISFFVEVPVAERTSVVVNVPVMRPILFGAAFDMLQFEPEARVVYRATTEGSTDFLVGPSLGIILHYGPDYRSAGSGDGRRPSFFAIGPRLGAYLGLDFERPDHPFNFQLGLHPYVSPLFSVGDPEEHRGWIVGAMLEGLFRFEMP